MFFIDHDFLVVKLCLTNVDEGAVIIMKYKMPYNWVEEIEVNDMNLVGIFSPKVFTSRKNENEVIMKGFASPIGTKPLRDAAKDARSVLILSDDNSRPTPVNKLLPIILKELGIAEVPDENISILMSLGTHRAMTDEEIDRKLGYGIRQRFKVFNHQWNNVDNMINLGQSKTGNDILVNKKVVEADFVIGIGNIVPHPAAGFAGGGKIVDPGCVSDETCGAFHWESVKLQASEVLGVRDNPMIQMIDEVAEKAGLKFIVNTIMDGDNHIVRVVTGHPSKAHSEGCKTAIEVYGVEIPERADIVICDSHPADLEMWQAIKGLCTADLVMKNDGIVIMATPCPDGASKEHPQLEQYGYRSFSETEKLIKQGKISLVVGHHLVQGGRLIGRSKQVFIVSNHLNNKTISNLGFCTAATVTDAYKQAMEIKGQDAKVVILRNAAELFPIMKM